MVRYKYELQEQMVHNANTFSEYTLKYAKTWM